MRVKKTNPSGSQEKSLRALRGGSERRTRSDKCGALSNLGTRRQHAFMYSFTFEASAWENEVQSLVLCLHRLDETRFLYMYIFFAASNYKSYVLALKQIKSHLA